MTLAQLHLVVQAAMGWQNVHLHEFRIGRQRFGVPDPDDLDPDGCKHDRKVQIHQVLGSVGASGEYVYDFGDNWEHGIQVEEIAVPEDGRVYPLCIGGELAGPPEDCGGIGGFYKFLDAIRDRNHEEHKAMLEWVGGSFDPEYFSPEAVNEKLRRTFRPARKKAARPAKGKSKPASVAAANRNPTRKRIRPDETVPLELNDSERSLILDDTSADDELTERLRVEPNPGESPVYRFNLSDLDALAGFVAAEANHATNKKQRKRCSRCSIGCRRCLSRIRTRSRNKRSRTSLRLQRKRAARNRGTV